MLEGYSAEEERNDTAHVHAGAHEVAGKGDEGDDARLDSREEVEMRVLEDQRRSQSESYSESHRDGELKQEDGDSVEEGRDENVVAVEVGESPIGGTNTSESAFIARNEGKGERHLLVQNNTDSIVDEALAEDDRVELWIDLVRVEDGQDRNGVGRRQSRTEDQALNQGEFDAFETCERPEVDEDSAKDSGEDQDEELVNTARSSATHPRPTAEMNVPKNAKVKMTPKLRKKFSCRTQ